MERLKGFEVLHALIREQLRSKQDCLVAMLHSLLINETLVCVGTGDDWTADAPTSQGSELLPEDWNVNQDIYTLRYTDRELVDSYLVKVVKTGDSLLVNVVKGEEVLAAMSVPVSAHVSDDYKTFSKAFVDLPSAVDAFVKHIADRIRNKDTRGSQKTKNLVSSSNDNATQFADLSMGFGQIFLSNNNNDDDDEYAIHRRPRRPSAPRVGGADLDPLGRGRGGGMIMDPGSLLHRPGRNGPGGLPRGAVPPGARFDPIRPPVPGRGRGRVQPNPDHLPPPGFDDELA